MNCKMRPFDTRNPDDDVGPGGSGNLKRSPERKQIGQIGTPDDTIVIEVR